MRRSSRILCFLITATMTPAVAEARGSGARGVGPVGRPLVAPRIGMPRVAVRPGFRPGRFPGWRGRLGRFGRGYGFGGYGYGGIGLGFGDLGTGGPGLPLGAGNLPEPYGPPQAGPVFVPPPACPMIIAVGAGLRHPARTRIVYGRQPFCGS